jgi:L-lactate utilization protein LutC
MIKDHQIGEMNNQLRFTALKFAKAEQLRSRLAGVVAPLIDQANDEIADLRWEQEILRFERNVAQAELGIANKKIAELESDIEQSGGKL